MKICHIITRLIVGGAQENTVLSCEGLVENGHDVTLIAGPETGPEGSLWDQANRSGARLIRLDALRRSPHPFRDLRCRAALTRIFRDGRFDVVHTHSSKAGILGRWAANRAGVPVIVHTIHGMSFNRTQSAGTRALYRFLERRAARVTHRIVTVADAMIQQAVDAGIAPPERFTTIYSGMAVERYTLDIARRAAVRAEWGVSDNTIVVGTVARLFANKGYDEIIAAMPRAVHAHADLKFVWVGAGAHREKYLRRLRDIDLGRFVHLTGLVAPDEVPRLIGGFDLLVHASRWEGLPRAVVQALLMEVPAISFDNDGAPEIVTNGETGILVPYGHIDGLADAIVKLVRSPDQRRRMGAEGRRRCRLKFRANEMVRRLDALYAELMAAKRSDGSHRTQQDG